MGTAETLRLERNGRTIPLARFYADYKSESSNICYGFVEGKSDPSYYRTIINNQIPSDCSIMLYASNGKKNVKYIYEEISRRNYPHERITFYIDRDLSPVIQDDNIVVAPNVYITDKYSIENDILSEETLEGILQDILGFTDLSVDEIHKIKADFIIQRSVFEDMMKPVMANIIFWKRNNYKPANYNNLKIEDLISVKDCKVSLRHSREDMIRILYTQSNMPYEKYDEMKVNSIVDEINATNLSSHILRGKYLSVFFVKFCNSLFDDYETLGYIKNKGQKICVNDVITIVAPRSRPPYSLLEFIKNNIVNFFVNRQTKGNTTSQK